MYSGYLAAQAVPFEKLAPSHAGSATVRSKRGATLPDTAEVRAAADAQVAKSFAKALATRSYQTSIEPPGVLIPQQSTLGRWRTQLDSAFKSPGLLAWAKQQGLDTTRLKLDPLRGELTGSVGGKPQTFSLVDDSGWADVSRTLLSVASAIAPKAGQAFSYPWPDGKVPLSTVGRFYNTPIDLTPAQAALHRKKLMANALFEFAPVPFVSQRSAKALAQQREALGDEANRHALISALKSQVDDANGRVDLGSVKIAMDPRSSAFASAQRGEMTVAQILEQQGNKVPINRKQALDVALALSFDLAHRAPGPDAGGVRPLAGALSATSLRKMQAVVNEWMARPAAQVSETQSGAAAGSLLGRLIATLPDATRKMIKDNPAMAMDRLIRSPDALELGQKIQQKLKLLETPTSAIESVSAALVKELDPGAGKSSFNLAGYDLYSQYNAGFSPADIVKRFTTHLERKVGVEAAPIAARLLLSAAAPELLVKNMPPNLVYGSHTWANFCIEVSRIEQQVPGASANMTFSQVMAFGDAPPVSLEGEDQLNAAARDPIIAWGVANDVIKGRPDYNYTDAEAKRAQQALNKQQEELAWAKDTLLSVPVTRETLALAELKRVFPDVDPTLEVFQGRSVKHPPVSLLDIYMTGPIKVDKWKSLDNKAFPYEAMRSRFSNLEPDINTAFSKAFEDFKKTQKTAWAIQFKYQVSLLPAADRERIKTSKVTFIEVSRPFLETELSPAGSGWYPATRIREPTDQEREERKGKYGLQMKVEGRDGVIDHYSYFPLKGQIVKDKGDLVDDSAYFNGRSTGRVRGNYNRYMQYGETHYAGDPVDAADKIPGAYFADNTGELALTASTFFMRSYDAVRHKAAGVTVLEQGKADDAKLKSFFLSLLPFYDGIQDAIKGNTGGAAFNIGFDILGFVLPGLSAARKASKAGKGSINIIKSGVFSGVGASLGYTDTVNITPEFNT